MGRSLSISSSKSKQNADALSWDPAITLSGLVEKLTLMCTCSKNGLLLNLHLLYSVAAFETFHYAPQTQNVESVSYGDRFNTLDRRQNNVDLALCVCFEENTNYSVLLFCTWSGSLVSFIRKQNWNNILSTSMQENKQYRALYGHVNS